MDSAANEPETVGISVVIATYGRAALLRRLLEALAQQTLPTACFEVVVSIDGQDPASQEVLEQVAKSQPTLRWCRSAERRGPAVARNAALRFCAGEIIAITDDDCVPSNTWLEAIRDAFEAAPQFGVVIGRTTTDRTELTPFSHYVENLSGHTHQTCNIAYRRAVMEALGGFDERFPFSHEDTDLYVRAESVTQAQFVPAVHVEHPPRALTVSDIVRSARKFEGDFIFAAKHPALYRSRHGGRGPLAATVWDVALKHSVKQVVVNVGWLARRPDVYLRFVAAQVLFSASLLVRAPAFWHRHRRGFSSDDVAARIYAASSTIPKDTCRGPSPPELR